MAYENRSTRAIRPSSSAAANRSSSGISMAAVQRKLDNAGIVTQQHNKGCCCSSCSATVQRVKIYGNSTKELLDTDTASLKELNDLLKKKTSYKLSAQEIVDVKEAIDRFNPLLGASDKTGQGAPKSKSVPVPLNERKLTPGKRSKEMGQVFSRSSVLPPGINNLSGTDSMDVPKLDIYKRKESQGLVRKVPRMVGSVEKKVAVINCAYCLEATPLEATDLDHVIATEHLRKHLLNIAQGLSSKEYRVQLEGWMKGMKLQFADWFKTNDGGKNYYPTAQAMKFLHNTGGNLLLACKTCNQSEKNDTSFEKFAKDNPWIGPKFLSAHPPLPANAYLTTSDHTPIADAIEEFQESEFGPMKEEILDIHVSQSRLTVKSKQIGLGQKKEKKSIDTHDRRLRWNANLAEMSSEDESEEEFGIRLSAKMGQKYVPKKELKAERKKKEEAEEKVTELSGKLKEHRKKRKERRKQIRELKSEKRDLSKENEELRAKLQEHEKLLQQIQTAQKVVADTKKKQDDGTGNTAVKRKRTASLDASTNQSQSDKKKVKPTSLSAICKDIDNHNGEVPGTNQPRINLSNSNGNFDAFVNAYLQKAIPQWQPLYFPNSSFKVYRSTRQAWWQGLRSLLQQAYTAKQQ